MSAVCFVDTNLLVYRLDSQAGKKQETAAAWMQHLWESQTGRLSTQVLNEFYQVVTRKLRPGLPVQIARTEVEDLMAWDPVTIDGDVMFGAFAVESRYQLSFWDSLIVAAAQRADARYLLTEDLQAGQDLGGVRVVNPFETTAQALEAHL